MAKRLAKTTKKQYEELLAFLEKNKILLTGKTKPSETKKIAELWKQFALSVNSKSVGAPKTADQWRHVFNEWKTNTRRKSRCVEIHKNKTGGGPPSEKGLNEIEEKLLSLLSKIHLGDNSLPDSFASVEDAVSNCSEMVAADVFENPISVSVDDITIPMLPIDKNIFCTGKSSEDTIETAHNTPGQDTLETANVMITPSTIRSNGRCKKPEKSFRQRDERYTSNILRSACEQYASSQKSVLEMTSINADAITKLSSAIADCAKAIDKKAKAEKEKNYINLKLAKMQYYTLFQTFDGFDDL